MKHLDADTYEKLFGPVSEDESNHLLSISLPKSVYQCLSTLATSDNISISEFIANLISNQ